MLGEEATRELRPLAVFITTNREELAGCSGIRSGNAETVLLLWQERPNGVTPRVAQAPAAHDLLREAWYVALLYSEETYRQLVEVTFVEWKGVQVLVCSADERKLLAGLELNLCLSVCIRRCYS